MIAPAAVDASPVVVAEKPTRTRYLTLAFALSLAVITYIDRVGISQASGAIRRDLGLTTIEMGWVLGIFGWTYALFEIPGGWLADRIGPRRVLMRIVLWWSFFTAATGWAWNFTSLIVARALFGAGEAGCYPSLTRRVHDLAAAQRAGTRAGDVVARLAVERRVDASSWSSGC